MKRVCIVIALSWVALHLSAQTLVDSNLTYDEVIIDNPTGTLNLPIAIEFLSPDDPNRFFLLEKWTGKVYLVENGALSSLLLDLPVVTSNWERGLLGIALHPNFAENGYVYFFYSLSRTGDDSQNANDWIGNRIERYTWNGSALVDPMLIWEFPRDPSQTNAEIHNGGVLVFGPDGKLYCVHGDLIRGRFNRPRIEQNTDATAVAGVGGIYRLNDDGSIPEDNPFVYHGDSRIRALWAYGIRNSFGLTFDSLTGKLWMTENGPNVYDEINLVRRGFNSGWLKIMGPDSRNATYTDNNNTNYDASDLVYLPNSYYDDPKFSWLTPIGVSSIVFLRSARFEEGTRDQAIVGESNIKRLYKFDMNPNRNGFVFNDPRLQDLVADDATERDLVMWGRTWGIVSDLKIGPDGFLYVCTHIGDSSVRAGIRRIRPVNPPEILNGKAILAGRQGLPLGVSLTLSIYENDTLVQTITTTLDAYGKFSERLNQAGKFRIVAKAGTYLSVFIDSVSVAPQGFAYREFVFTVNGDVNGDDIIDDADLLAVLFDLGQSNSPADLNNNGIVDDADLLIVMFNFGKSG